MKTASEFNIGDSVLIKRGKFGPYTVTGFRTPEPGFRPEATIFINNDTPWYAREPKELRKLTEEEANQIRKERAKKKSEWEILNSTR